MEKSNLNFLNEDILKIHNHIDFSELSNKKILITGATGLLGLYFLLSLKNIFEINKIEITIIHNSEIDKVFNNFINFSKINCVKGDITDTDFLSTNLGTYDYIIHAAGYGQPGKFLENKLKTIELNTSITNFLLKRLNSGGKFLFTSSSEVYSGLAENQIETNVGSTTPFHSRSCYIEGKICGETICNIYRESGVDVKIVRISLTYGPGTKKGDKRMLTNFIEKALINKKIELIDDGDGIRTFLYVADATIMMWNILFNSKDILYNVGGDSTESIYNTALLIGKNLDVDVFKPDSINKLKGSPELVKINMDKYYAEFGDLNLDSFENGLKKTIDWHKEIYC